MFFLVLDRLDSVGAMVWIGLNHLKDGWGWQWSDGAPLALVNFTTGMINVSIWNWVMSVFMVGLHVIVQMLTNNTDNFRFCTWCTFFHQYNFCNLKQIQGMFRTILYNFLNVHYKKIPSEDTCYVFSPPTSTFHDTSRFDTRQDLISGKQLHCKKCMKYNFFSCFI